jgi:hypothetical protein
MDTGRMMGKRRVHLIVVRMGWGCTPQQRRSPSLESSPSLGPLASLDTRNVYTALEGEGAACQHFCTQWTGDKKMSSSFLCWTDRIALTPVLWTLGQEEASCGRGSLSGDTAFSFLSYSGLSRATVNAYLHCGPCDTYGAASETPSLKKTGLCGSCLQS